MKIKRDTKKRQKIDFTVRNNGALVMHIRLCIPNIGLKRKILAVAHNSAYVMHPRRIEALRCIGPQSNFIVGWKRKMISQVKYLDA